MKTNQHRRYALNLTLVDGFLTAVMIGTAETFAMVLAVKSGLSAEQLATLSTLPILLGAMVQWIFPQLIRNEHLKVAILCSHSVQILGLASLLWVAGSSRGLPDQSAPLFRNLLTGLSLYWMGGMVSGPLWLDWIAGWLPHKRFARYLSRRNAFIAGVTLLSYLLAASRMGQATSMEAFKIIFAMAVMARLLSWGVVALQPSPVRRTQTVAEGLRNPEWWSSKPVLLIVGFTTLFKFAVNLSSPFFLPFMFNDLKLGLSQYVALTAIPFVGRFLFMSRWGEAAKSIRPFIGLQITMVCISLSPILWTLTRSFYWLCAFEFVSGAMWGGFELCSILIIQNFWPGSARRLMGIHFALMSLFALVGASLGSYFLSRFHWSYIDLFTASGDLRGVTTLLFVVALTRIRETRSSLKVYGDFLTTVLSLRPSFANIGRVIPLRRRRRAHV